ncbi:hypothetical protein FACS189472_13460 [Alphaproteobacteria bacterium]|nr:hypothetical protein FACS189472_13460 [Alphaproteobacteria bacterium]
MLNQVQKILALNEVGSVNEILRKCDPKLGMNEGIGKYDYLTVESPSARPFDANTEITIPLTNSNVDIVEFGRSFFTLNLKVALTVRTEPVEDTRYGFGNGKTDPKIENLAYIRKPNTSTSPPEKFATAANLTDIIRRDDLIFFGYKNSSDAIESYRIQHNGVDIGTTMQNNAGTESFLYNQMKPEIEKQNKSSSYSLWENVIKADESVCGTYVDYNRLIQHLNATGNNIIHIEFPVTIGFDMLLPLQSFNFFPNCLFGDLTLIIKTNPNAMVWACTDPAQSIQWRVRMNSMTVENNKSGLTHDKADEKFLLDRAISNGITPYKYLDFSHRFTQMKCPGICRTACYVCADVAEMVEDWSGTKGFTPDAVRVEYAAIPAVFDKSAFWTETAQSIICGFTLKDSVKLALAQYYRKIPYCIPSEKIFQQSFSTPPSASGLNCTMNIPLINAKEIIALFPRNANEITTFRNPEYQSCMLTLLNRNFPQKGADTNSYEFYRLMLESCNLDSIISPCESFENSYLRKVCPYRPFRQRCKGDDTDFVMLFNLQRQSCNAFYSDPVKARNETISLTGHPSSPNDENLDKKGGDPYYYLDAENHKKNEVNKTAPILCIVSDTFWMFRVGERAVYDTTSTWNETLAKHYPEIFQRLAGAAQAQVIT